MQRKGGIIFLKVDGKQLQAVGNFTYGLGKPVRTTLVGPDGPHGFSELPTAGFIEGEIRDGQDLSLDEIGDITNATIHLELANGKVIALRNAHSMNPDGLTGNTEEGNIPVRFEGEAEEIR